MSDSHNVRVPVRVREKVRDRCDRLRNGTTSTAVVRHGLEAFVTDPDDVTAVIAYGRQRPADEETVQLSYRIDDDLWTAVQDRCDAMAADALRVGVVLSASLVAVRALDQFASTEVGRIHA